MAKQPKFADGTMVPVEKSRAELEALLERHGAREFAVFRDAELTRIVFRMKERMVRQEVRVPDRKAFEKDPRSTWKRRPEKQVLDAVDAEHRRRWRVLLLIVKGKLELIASGESSFEREFLADTLLPNGDTVAEAMLPRIAQAYASGEMPPLMLGPGGK